MCTARPEAVEAPAAGPPKPEPGRALEAASTASRLGFTFAKPEPGPQAAALYNN
jgi:hypothetical protein